jgi:hypothetical protein
LGAEGNDLVRETVNALGVELGYFYIFFGAQCSAFTAVLANH